MTLKQIDDKSPQIKLLESLYRDSQSQAQKRLIKADLDRLRAGHEAEKENAYYLDFGLKDSKNIILLHDIRIVHKDRSAQLDHILISRLGVEILETKSSKGSITINDDGSLTYESCRYKNTYPNPLEQSKRHALVLKEFIGDNISFPKRIMLLGGIDVKSRVLIHPTTNIVNHTLPEDYQRADSFISAREKESENISTLKAISALSRVYDIDKAKEIASLLLDSHTPVEFDYSKKYRTKRQKPEHKPKKENRAVSDSSSHIDEKCPRCKEGTLVLRAVKSKAAREKYNADSFLGCSRYPKCRYARGN